MSKSLLNKQDETGEASSPFIADEKAFLKTAPKVLDSKEGVSLYLDKGTTLAKAAYKQLGIELDETTVLLSFAFVWQEKIIGVVSWTDYRANHDMWWTIVTTNKHWCTKKVLDYLFKTAKKYFHCDRINALTRTDNLPAVCLLKRLGFEQEGRLKGFYPVFKTDAYVWAKFL